MRLDTLSVPYMIALIGHAMTGEPSTPSNAALSVPDRVVQENSTL